MPSHAILHTSPLHSAHSAIRRSAITRRSDPALLAHLRARIHALEMGSEVAAIAATPLGFAVLDETLPWGGLPRGGVHEVESATATPAAVAAASGFAAALMARLIAGHGPALWCLTRADLYAPGLHAFGLDPARVIMVRAGHPEQALWVLEESLRAGRLGAVLGEVGALDLTAGRRLQLAAQASGTPCLLLHGHCDSGRGVGSSVALTRWRVAPRPAAGRDGQDGLGWPRWQVERVRCRGTAGAQSWQVDWCYETHCFALAAPLADRSNGAQAGACRIAG